MSIKYSNKSSGDTMAGLVYNCAEAYICAYARQKILKTLF